MNKQAVQYRRDRAAYLLSLPLISQHLPEGDTNPEWLNLRKNKITASEVSTALGLFGEAKKRLYIETKAEQILMMYGPKTKSAAFDISSLWWVKRGTDLEPVIRDTYSQSTGITIFERGFVQSEKYEWLGCSPDGLTEDGLLIEIKCPRENKGNLVPPPYHYIQTQTQMFVTELYECDLVTATDPENVQEGMTPIKVDRIQFDHRAWLPVEKALCNVWAQIQKRVQDLSV